MHANRSIDKTTSRNFDRITSRLLPPKAPRNQRLDRPGDLKNIQLLSAYPDSKIKIVNGLIMIPIPPEDAKALGLRAPDTDNSSVKSNSALSGSSTSVANPKTFRKKKNNEDKSKKEVKRYRNVDTKAPKKLLDLKQDRKAQRAATLERLSNLHAKLERGLKNISNRTKTRPKVRSDTVKGSNNTASNPTSNPTRFRGTGRSLNSGKFAKNSSSQEDKQEKLRRESSSKSTKQLFSTTESWSSDSVVSHSDNCACCHSREPCPFHGSDFFQGK